MLFPERLREIREWYGLSQSALGAYLGIPQGTYSKRELPRPAGREPDLSELKRLSWFLCVSTDWLLGQPGTQKWGPAAWLVRRHVHAQLPNLQIGQTEDFRRLAWLLDLIQSVIPDTLPALNPATLLACEPTTLVGLRSGSIPLAGTAAAARLAEFCGVSELWLAVGEYVPSDGVIYEWLPYVREAELRGVEPATVGRSIDLLLSLQKRMKV